MKRISELSSTVFQKVAMSLICAVVALAQTGCASVERSKASGYADQGRDLTDGRDRRALDREAMMERLGYDRSRDLSDRESETLNSRLALAKAEKALEGKREREQYYKNKPYMRNDADRLAFLNLDSFETRQRWLNSKGVSPTSTRFSAEHQYLVDTNDITLGMTKQAVRESWGEPELVEVAGSPLYGNERWQYTEQASSTEGYQTQRRMVYFESGRVSGWESH
jgi:SmpA / OmlA family